MRHEPDRDAAPGLPASGEPAPVRRRLLASLPGMLAGTLPALALGAESAESLHRRTLKVIDRANARGLPDTWVNTHRGERVLLHRDLIRDRVVLVNFMSIGDEEVLPVCASMARLIAGLGESFGSDVIAISVSYDQLYDTPERLAGFAQRFGSPAGWHFVTAPPEDVLTVGYKLYRAEGRPKRQMEGDRLHFGNARVGLWATMSAIIHDVDLAVSRVRSVMPSPNSGGMPRRAGPRPLTRSGPIYDHRDRAGTA